MKQHYLLFQWTSD